MKKILSSLSTNLFIPLTPCIISLVIRIVYFGYFDIKLFDPSEISFSIAMYFIFCLIGVKNINDKELAQSLFTPYLILTALFIAFFTLSVFIKTQYDYEVVSIISSFSDANIETNNTNNLSTLLIDRLRITTIFASLFFIIISEITRFKYKIEV